MLQIEHEARRIAAIMHGASPAEKALVYKRAVDTSRMELTDVEGGLVKDSYLLGRLAQHLELPKPQKTVVDEIARAAIGGQLTVGLDTWRAIAQMAAENIKQPQPV